MLVYKVVFQDLSQAKNVIAASLVNSQFGRGSTISGSPSVSVAQFVFKLCFSNTEVIQHSRHEKFNSANTTVAQTVSANGPFRIV